MEAVALSQGDDRRLQGNAPSDAYQLYVTFEKGNEFVELAAC